LEAADSRFPVALARKTSAAKFQANSGNSAVVSKGATLFALSQYILDLKLSRIGAIVEFQRATME
jgi:hypothetical protein